MQIIIKKLSKAGTKVNIALAIKLQKEGLKNIYASTLKKFHGRYFADDIFNEKTGEVYFESGDEVTAESIRKIKSIKY
jgi:DNA-directed RNA polymerase subunit beta